MKVHKLVVVGFIALILAVGAYFVLKSPEQPPTPDSVKLRIGYIPIAECAHLYVGRARGFFNDEGLDVELVPMAGGAAILPAVLSGDVDIGFTNVVSLALLNAAKSGARPFIVLVGATYEREGYRNHALLVKKESRLAIRDLANARIALNTTHNIEELMLRRFLDKHAVPQRHLKLKPIPFPEMLAALKRGDVDVISVVEPFIQPPVLSSKQGVRVLEWQYLDVADETLVATYASTKQWLRKNEDIYRRFVRAFEKADRFIKSSDAETRDIIAASTRISPTDVHRIGMPAFELQIKPKARKEIIDAMRRFGFISVPISDDEMMPVAEAPAQH